MYLLEINQQQTAAIDHAKGGNLSDCGQAAKSGQNGIHDRLTRENETDIPAEELLVQRFLSPRS